MHLHVFISLRSFSPTLFLLDATTRLKISPQCSLMFLLINCICSNKIRFFPILKQSYFSEAIFPHPSSLNIFFFCFLFPYRFRVETWEKGRDLPQTAQLPPAKVSIRMKIQELIARVPAPNPGPPLPSAQSPAGAFCPAEARQPLLPLLTATKLP